MTSAVVLPTSISSASGCSSATASAVATQLAAATSHGRARASSTEMSSPAVVSTLGSPNASSAASSTNATPSRLVRNASDSSAVIVIATASAGLGRDLAQHGGEPLAVAPDLEGARHRPQRVPSCQAAFVFAPPMSTASVAGMRVVGVIDLKAGEAVHAVRGERERYRPLGDPLALARRFGGSKSCTSPTSTRSPAAASRRDHRRAGARGAGHGRCRGQRAGAARALLDLGVDRVVVGTETLTDADALACPTRSSAWTCATAACCRATRGSPACRRSTPSRACPGPREVIVLDLARVGTARGRTSR